MRCSNCGKEVTEGMLKCPYCSNTISAVFDEQGGNGISEENDVKKTLLGKRYTLSSSIGANLIGIFNSKIISEVEVGEDRLYIDMKPKRFNKSPVIFYQDVTEIVVSLKINFYYLFFIVVTAVLGLTGAYYSLILTALFVWFGRDRKIKIYQRNGIDVVMYCQTLQEAQEFVNDLQQLSIM